MSRNILLSTKILFVGVLLGLTIKNTVCQTINGIELPPPCTNCSNTTTSSSKVASTLGISTQATDSAAFASGKGSIAAGMFSSAFGYYSEANKHSSFAAGYMAEADSNYSIALGKYVITAGNNSYALGNYVKTTGNNSIVIGKGDQVNQNHLTNNISNSIIFGMGTTTPTMIIRGGEVATKRVGIKTTTPQADLDVNGTIQTTGFNLTTGASNNYVLTSDTLGSAAWEDPKTLGIWSLNGLYANYMGGNVGIGTSNPSELLEVAGTIKTQNISISGGSDGYVLKSDASGNASWEDPKTLGIWTKDDQDDVYYMDGNIGIGISDPEEALDISGTLQATGFKLTGGSEGDILKYDATGNAVWTDFEDISEWETNAQGRLVTDKITGVGIPDGITVRGAFQIGNEFTIWGTGINENKLIGNNYKWNNGPKRINDGGASVISIDDSLGNISLRAAAHGIAESDITFKDMIFTSEGNLGIGTNTPQYNLDVQSASGVDAHFHSTNANKSTIWASNSVGSFGFGVDASGAGHIYRSINEDNLMTFTTDGKVLISHDGATSTPDNHMLYVNGSILATEVKIATVGNWSDFVFAEDYHLPGLSDVESFIRQNGHLPGVPSEQQVKAEGLNLVETDALLLQKIEELTLYILQQEKKINTLQDKINKLTDGKEHPNQ